MSDRSLPAICSTCHQSPSCPLLSRHLPCISMFLISHILSRCTLSCSDLSATQDHYVFIGHHRVHLVSVLIPMMSVCPTGIYLEINPIRRIFYRKELSKYTRLISLIYIMVQEAHVHRLLGEFTPITADDGTGLPNELVKSA